MTQFLEPLLSRQEAAQADLHTIKSLRIPGIELMERAGRAIANEVEALVSKHASPLPAVPVAIICGPGNNGGDGFVAARRLWQNGIRVVVICLTQIDKLKNDARTAAEHFRVACKHDAWALTNLDPCLQELAQVSDLNALLANLKPIIIVDAIFGTGVNKPPNGIYAEAIDAINHFKKQQGNKLWVLSVDLPSGLACDGQYLSGSVVLADITLT